MTSTVAPTAIETRCCRPARRAALVACIILGLASVQRLCAQTEASAKEANRGSMNPAISADGRFVAFASSATNLVPDDTNGLMDIFVHDCQTGSTSRVSVNSEGRQGSCREGRSCECRFSSISADGRFVVFNSSAGNLVRGDTNGKHDIFLHDRTQRTTTRVSLSSDGQQANADSWRNAVSDDGRFVAFFGSSSNLARGETVLSWFMTDVFVRDTRTGQTTCVSVSSSGKRGNGSNVGASISSDGRFVAFHSGGSSLVSGDTNGEWDVFVHDRETGRTGRVSVDSSGRLANGASTGCRISADGRYVVFSSTATNLVEDDTNGVDDVFVHDRQTGETTRVSVSSSGQQAAADSWWPSVSGNGRYVAFASFDHRLGERTAAETRNIFVRHQQAGTTQLVSVASDGTPGNHYCSAPAISRDGRYVAFASRASNLVPGDNNGCLDIFVHDLQTGETSRVSVPDPPRGASE